MPFRIIDSLEKNGNKAMTTKIDHYSIALIDNLETDVEEVKFSDNLRCIRLDLITEPRAVKLLGKEHRVGIGRTELGVVMESVETPPRLKWASVQRETAEYVGQSYLGINEQLFAVGGTGQMGGQASDAPSPDYFGGELIDIYRNVLHARAAPPN